MRNDLAEALTAVRWADAHIPIMNKRLIAWKRCSPYDIVVEPDPNDAEWELLIAYPGTQLDPLIQGDVGAIINSMRTALDILMSTLLVGHGIEPNRKAQFPFRSTEAEFLHAVTMLESKKWISQAEAIAIKETRAYKDGDPILYSIHRLDIIRKHERLLTVEPTIRQTHLMELMPEFQHVLWHMDNKIILYRFPRGTFHPKKGNTEIVAEVFLREANVGVHRQPAVRALRAFTSKISSLIESFP